MAYSEQNPLDYRSGGDRVKQWGAKYKKEIPHIYNILNSLLKHQAYGDATVENEDGAMKIFTLSIEEEGGTVRTERHLAIGVDTGENFQWVDIGQIAPRFGAPLTSEALTNNDVATQEYEAYKLVKTDANGVLPADITGSAAKMVGKVIAVNNLTDGQVLVWRAYDQRWHNENKAAVGDGKALELKNGETTICLYSGESDQAVDIGKWNNITLTKTTDNIADIRYVATLETTSAETAKLQKATPEAEGRTFAMRDTDGYLFAVTPATNDSSQKVATTANVAAKVTAHNDDSEAHTAAFASQLATFKLNTLGYRQKNTLYSVGAQANADGLPEGYFLECTAPGTSGSSGIVLPETIVVGATVIDGTVMWKIRKKASTTEVENVKDDITAIQTELDSNNRKPSTTYAEKDIRYCNGLPVGWYLECTTDGTTSASDLVITSPVVGDTVTDGTVVWTIREIASTADISGKANVDLDNLSATGEAKIQSVSPRYLTDSYYDDTTGDWYRVYSDGWVEQGGIYTNATATSNIVVNLLKPMADDKYSVTVARKGNAAYSAGTDMINQGTINALSPSYNRPSTTSFYLNNFMPYSHSYGCGDAVWKVEGEGATS